MLTHVNEKNIMDTTFLPFQQEYHLNALFV